jgi:hypothetical protein
LLSKQNRSLSELEGVLAKFKEERCHLGEACARLRRENAGLA